MVKPLFDARSSVLAAEPSRVEHKAAELRMVHPATDRRVSLTSKDVGLLEAWSQAVLEYLASGGSSECRMDNTQVSFRSGRGGTDVRGCRCVMWRHAGRFTTLSSCGNKKLLQLYAS